MNKTINLYAQSNYWLYKEHEDGNREFHKSITCSIDEEKNWHECTEKERSDWEKEQKNVHYVDVTLKEAEQ